MDQFERKPRTDSPELAGGESSNLADVFRLSEARSVEESNAWLSDALQHRNPSMRLFAVQEITSVGAECIIEHLDQLVQLFQFDENSSVRSAVLTAVGQVPAAEQTAYATGVSVLGAAICDPDMTIRMAGWQTALGKMEKTASLLKEFASRIEGGVTDTLAHPFCSLANKSEAEDVKEVSHLLEEFVSDSILPDKTRELAARVLLKTDDPKVAALIARTAVEETADLAREGWETQDFYPELFRVMVNALVDHARKGGDVSSALDEFQGKLLAPDIDDTQKALVVRAASRRKAWRSALKEEIEYVGTDPQLPRTRSVAIHPRTEDFETFAEKKELVLQALNDPDHLVRANGLAALVLYGDVPSDPDIEARLGDLLMESDPQIVQQAAHLLGKMAGRGALPVLKDIYSLSSNPDIRRELKAEIRSITFDHPRGIFWVADRIDRGVRASLKLLKRIAGIKEKSTIEKMNDVLRERGIDPSQFDDD